MPIEFVCSNPDCGKKLRVSDRVGPSLLSGKAVKCPHCGAPVVVPESSAAASASSAGRPRETSTRTTAFLVTAGAVVLAAAIGVALLLARRVEQPDQRHASAPTAAREAKAPEADQAAARPAEKQAPVAPPPAPAQPATKEPKPAAVPIAPSPAPKQPVVEKPAPVPAPKPPAAAPVPPAEPVKAAPPAARQPVDVTQWIKFLKDASPENRRQAAMILGELKDSAAIGPLLDASGDEDTAVQEALHAALAKLDPLLVEAERRRRGLQNKEMADAIAAVNDKIDAFDYGGARAQARRLDAKYPAQMKVKLANLDRMEALRKECFARLNSGKVKVRMEDVSPRYAFAGDCTHADGKGLTARITVRWEDFRKHEVASFYRRTMAGTSGADHVALAVFLVEGSFDEREHNWALDLLDKGAEMGEDVSTLRGYMKMLGAGLRRYSGSNIHEDLAPALLDAGAERKALLVLFSTSWQPKCADTSSLFEKEAIREIVEKSFHFVTLDVNDFEDHQECCKTYKVTEVPHLIAFNRKGKPVAAITGCTEQSLLATFLKGAAAAAR